MNEEIFIDLESGGHRRRFKLSVKPKRNARNLVLRIAGSDAISVSAPLRASLGEIKNFAKKHADWVFAELDRMPETKTLSEYFLENPRICIRGKMLKVSLMASRSKAFYLEDFDRGEVVFSFPNEASLKKMFLRYVKEEMVAAVESIAASHRISAGKISVRDQRSRWASRSSTGTYSFNWRMVLLDFKFQEYIILHELAHEKFMDHSVSFWIYLSRLCPNAKTLDKQVSKEGLRVFRVER